MAGSKEEVLWTLRKGDRVAEARTSPGEGAPQLRIYTGSGPKRDTYGQVSVQMVRDPKALRELADEKKREFEAAGWGEA
jgi:hypothetical protein